MNPPRLILRPNREKSVIRHHPWIFSGAIESVSDNTATGQTVAIHNNKGEFLAWGAYNPNSQIACRIWSWDENDIIDDEFIKRKILTAFGYRKNSFSTKITNSYRTFFSESDGIPGLVIDLYDNHLVLQITSASAEFWRNAIIETCRAIPGVDHCFERSESEMRKKEGLLPKEGVIFGTKPDNPIEITEWDIHYLVDITKGQKTGFFLDQRQNRKKVQPYAKNGRILNCFSYTGGFSLNAFVGGASEIISIDSSLEANQCARENWVLNSFPIEQYSCIERRCFSRTQEIS